MAHDWAHGPSCPVCVPHPSFSPHLVCVQGCVGFGGTYRRVVANNRSRQEKLPYSLTWPVVTTWRQDGHNTRLEEVAPYTCNSSFNATGNVGGKWSSSTGYILPCFLQQ